eukprot:scaffold230993_cov40-Tisochrysis_lutea.AAC.1
MSPGLNALASANGLHEGLNFWQRARQRSRSRQRPRGRPHGDRAVSNYRTPAARRAGICHYWT